MGAVLRAFVLRVAAVAVLVPALPAARGQAGPDGVASAPARPRVALVLSGGGARGFAHIGVLRALREMRVPVDIVAGTSMGSVVGGAYAAGVSVEALEALVRGTDWNSVVADRPARDELAFRRREDDLLLPSRIEFGVGAGGVVLPPSAAGNAALELALSRLLPPGTRDRPVSRLPLPFRAVASDLVTGEEVELVDTPLFMAMRASLAVPGVFAPVRVDHRLLADGGLVRNLPITMARSMGAQVVIAVNVGTPLADESELGSAVGVARQMLRILTEQNVQRSLRELQAQDILVAPDLSTVSFLDFHAHERAMQAGADAARAMAPRLQALAVSPQAYAALEQQRLAVSPAADPPLPVASVEVRGGGRIAPAVLQAQSGLQVGAPASRADLDAATRRLYGRADLERVEIESTTRDGVREVQINATEAEWAHSRARIGLELGSDFRDGNVFNVGLLHVRTSLNDWGAELRTVARVGTRRQLSVMWWQPLGPGSPWYLAPELHYGAGANDLFADGRRVLRFEEAVTGAALMAGRQLGDWGDVQLGVARRRARLRALVPDDGAQQPVTVFDNSRFVHLRADTLDSLAFPAHGVLLDATWEQSLAAQEDSSSLARSQAIGLAAFGGGGWAGHVYAEWGRAQAGLAALSLGGFMRLSGTPMNSVEGRVVVLSRLVLARRIGEMPLGLGGMLRAGFSLEAGGGFAADEAVRAGALRRAASAFVSVDTRFGPVFLGAGATRRGGSTLYIFLGPIWQ